MIQDEYEPTFEDVIKKPIKNAGLFTEEKKLLNCGDWKSCLVDAYTGNQQRKDMMHKNFKPGKSSGHSNSVFGNKIKQMVANKQKEANDAGQVPRMSTNVGDGSARGTASASGNDGTPTAPLSNTNKDKAKNAKVKDFYSSLLNKRKGEGAKKKAAPETKSEADTGAAEDAE